MWQTIIAFVVRHGRLSTIPDAGSQKIESRPVSIHKSIALIRHPDRPEQEWLGVFDERRQCYAFVTAERLNQESWRECLDRELSWALDLRRGKDYLISHMARLHFDESCFDPHSGDEVETALEFYVVDPYGRRGRAAFEQLDGVRWLTNEELRQAVTSDRVDIDPWLADILRRTDLIPKG
ncbi:MAG: hypothetical protein NXI04_12490 [Planctomycetaceae bacterium]|nr:hypothetical protein [Planctomycetaceae bacterium]